MVFNPQDIPSQFFSFCLELYSSQIYHENMTECLIPHLLYSRLNKKNRVTSMAIVWLTDSDFYLCVNHHLRKDLCLTPSMTLQFL